MSFPDPAPPPPAPAESIHDGGGLRGDRQAERVRLRRRRSRFVSMKGFALFLAVILSFSCLPGLRAQGQDQDDPEYGASLPIHVWTESELAYDATGGANIHVMGYFLPPLVRSGEIGNR